MNLVKQIGSERSDKYCAKKTETNQVKRKGEEREREREMHKERERERKKER